MTDASNGTYDVNNFEADMAHVDLLVANQQTNCGGDDVMSLKTYLWKVDVAKFLYDKTKDMNYEAFVAEY